MITISEWWWISACGLMLAGCDRGGESVPVPVVDTAVIEQPVVEPPRPAVEDPQGLIGWWRGVDTCIEIFNNGDFELIDNGRPKVMLMGKVRATAKDGGFSLELATERIWSGRYMSNCRKVHRSGAFKETHGVLGVPFKIGETRTLQLRRTGEATVELCGTVCEALKRETPHLGARWRRESPDSLGHPDSKWEVGELLELDIEEASGHLWIGRAEHKFGRLMAKIVARHVGPDQFVVTVTPERYDLEASTIAESPSALGLTFAVGGTQELAVRRLAGERVEICGPAEPCVTMTRQFDSHAYGFD